VAGGLHYVTVTLMTIYQQSNDRQIEVESKSIRSYNHRIAHSRCYYVTTSSVIDDLLLVKAVIATTIRLRFDCNSTALRIDDPRDDRRPTHVKVKVHTLDIALLRSQSPPQKRSGMARVLKGFHSFTCSPTRSSAIGMSHTCLCLPSYNWYSFTDPEGMEG